MNRLRAFWMASAVVFAAGVALSVRSALLLGGGTAAKLRRQAFHLEQLRGMASDEERRQEAVEDYARRFPDRPAALANLLKEHLPEIKPADVRESQRASIRGWVVRQRELDFRDVPIARVMAFVGRVETLGTPWILSRCSVTASARGPGIGDVQLTLESPDRLGEPQGRQE